jgi:hypothetical protein
VATDRRFTAWCVANRPAARDEGVSLATALGVDYIVSGTMLYHSMPSGDSAYAPYM